MLTLPLQDLTRLVEITPLGLKLHPEVTEEESRQVFETIARMDTAMDFIIGDWITQHTERFGRESTDTILQQQEFDFVRAMRCEVTCRIPESKRNPKLTAAHHHAVARNTKNEEEQQQWLSTAEDEHLAPAETARSIRKGEVMRQEERKTEYPSNAGIPFTLESVVLRFTGWQRWVQERDPMTDWDTEKLQRVRNLMRTFLTFAADIEMTLGERKQ
jgi:hypothetical protein